MEIKAVKYRITEIIGAGGGEVTKSPPESENFAQEVTMQKVERILVPIDFSEESAAALRDAVSLVRETKAKLIALHVIDVSAESDFLLSCIAPVGASHCG